MASRKIPSVSSYAAFIVLMLGVLPLEAQLPFLRYDFDDGSLAGFLNPNGPEAINLCGDIIPAGVAAVESDEVLLTNDEFLGIALLALDPAKVNQVFPAGSRNYVLSVDVNLESVNQLSVYVRGRLGFIAGTEQIDAQLERGYVVSVVAQGIEPAALDGFLAVAEMTACHEIVPHPEWPGATAGGYAAVDPGRPIVPGEWYNLMISAQGDDDGGPVTLDVRFHGAEALPPGHITLVDADGLDHTVQTLSADADTEVVFGTSFDFAQQPLATCRLDNLVLTALSGCEIAPMKARRSLWNPKVSAEGVPAALYQAGGEYQVRLALSDPRAAGACAAASEAVVTETLPVGWTAKDISNGGFLSSNTVNWNVSLPAAAGTELTYTAKAAGSGRVNFSGKINEGASSFSFLVEGESAAVDALALPQVSDFGSIQHWLILGPFLRLVGGANPGDEQLVLDYLTDGTITEADIEPRAGDTIEPDYAGAAASTGLAPNSLGRNPGDVPTWIEWRDYDDADDRVDFESVYGAANDVLCYAVTYLEADDDILVNFGVSSDDAVQILLDGEELHKNNVARGALGRMYQDTPLTHPKLGGVTLTRGVHTLLVKVFEGGGEHNFRVGFLDDTGVEIPGGPEGLTVRLEVAPSFRRGDANGSGDLNITDGVFILNYLFAGGSTPRCLDAADSDDSGELNITDGVRVLNFLFTGGPEPPAPGTEVCGPDPTADELREPCVYENC